MRPVYEEDKEDNEDVNPEISNTNQLMDVTKQFNSAQYVRDIVNAVKDGDVEPAKAMTVLKRFEKVAKKCFEDKEFKQICIDDIMKHLTGNTRTVELYSAKISRGATSTAYDFSVCGHPILDELYKIQEIVKEEITRYQEELKLLIQDSPKLDEFSVMSNSKEIVVDRMPILKFERNEDQVRVNAPIKYQTMGVKFMKV